jgi:hypothetical protein
MQKLMLELSQAEKTAPSFRRSLKQLTMYFDKFEETVDVTAATETILGLPNQFIGYTSNREQVSGALSIYYKYISDLVCRSVIARGFV